MITAGETRERTIDICRRVAGDHRVTDVSTDHEEVKARLLPDAPDNPDVIARVHVVLAETRRLPKGIFRAIVRVRTTSRDVPELLIPVTCMVRPGGEDSSPSHVSSAGDTSYVSNRPSSAP